MATPSSPGSVAFGGTRVVVVAHGPPMRGGIATVALDLVEDPVLNEEFEMIFFNTSQNDDRRGELALGNLVRAARHAWGTFRLSRRGGVVHSHSVQEPVFVAWRQVAIAAAARLRGSRVLLHNHSGAGLYMCGPGEYLISRPHRWAFALLDRLVDANVMIAEAGVPNIAMYMPHTELPVVYNSVVVEEIEPSTADHDPPVVLFVGEMLERKGLVVLMDALDILERRGAPAFELRIVGDNRPGLDPDKDAMVKLVGERGRADSMTGPLPRSEVYRHLREADVFVTPTYSEGQPFTVIESLAAGVPLVASDIPAISAMMTDPDNGRLVPTGDAEAFADALSALLGDVDERRRISAANRELARRRYDRSVFRARIAELYRGAAGVRDR